MASVGFYLGRQDYSDWMGISGSGALAVHCPIALLIRAQAHYQFSSSAAS
jgi:hypothetical protein